ncbi:MAG TPA: bifunctional metallophosphatase/5'-nucleotidase [Gemmatimonadales bacterium]|nr:bifunctional metallophosphatase/5'-nucleotidase [Gemmatimonadales bacterium]
MGGRLARRAAGAILLGLAACAGPGKPAPLNPVRFLLVNDVYVADTLADGNGGLARVATVRGRLADTGPVLFVLAGDVLSPSLLSKYYSGRQMVEALNAAKLDYATFGNHEFELPLDTLVARIAESQFKWISTNCTQADGTPIAKVLPWDTVRVSGHKVGLFGVTLVGAYRKAYRCSDPDSAAHIAIDTLVAQGAELVVGVTHQTIEADRNLLAREGRLDLVLGGHEHEAHDSVVSGRHVLKADANARTAQFVTLWGGKGAWRQAVGLVKMDSRLPDDTVVAAVVDRWDDSLRARLGPERALGRTSLPIDARDALGRQQESVLGDLVTDAMRTGTGADAAILNAGTLRLDDVIRPGPLTNYQLESIFLFPDETRVLTVPLTGARLRELLEHGVAEGSLGKGAFLQVSGVGFTYDPKAPSGRRLVGDLRRAGGGPLRPADTLRVAVPVYPACEGGDGYVIPEAGPACAARQSAPRAADLLMQYVADSLGGNVTAPATGRIVRTGNTNPG